MRTKLLVVAVCGVLALLVSPTPAQADHSWGGYHWARTSNPFTLKLGDNVDSKWDSYLATTSADWTASTVLATTIGTGSTRPRTCKASSGRIEVCNATYGSTGWLGVATISIAGGTHITAGTVKLNDTYFNTAKYNTPAWRNLVMCQEVGHDFGLDHNDEDFNNTPTGTCMDYSNDPEPNQHPNAHDYEQLAAIYSHTDTTNTAVSSSGPANSAAAALHGQDEWGRAVRLTSDGRPVIFERELGQGERLITFVVWAV